MERFQWAELGSVEPAILVKSLGKYVLVQVKEFPAGQVGDKVYEWGGSIVLKTELAMPAFVFVTLGDRVRSERTDGVLFLTTTKNSSTSAVTTSSLIVMTGWLTVDQSLSRHCGIA